MTYPKTTWQDRAVQFPNRYDKSGETSAQVTLTSNPGTVTQAGTPINAANLNKIEQGIADAHDGIATHAATTTGIHGAVSTPTANALVIRDASGRAQFADPVATVDASTKGYTDAAIANAKPVKGSYTGDNAASRDIALPFTPSAVLLMPNTGLAYSISASAGLALNGSPTVSNVNNSLYKILIGTNKFTVFTDTSNSIRTNDTGIVYNYIAFP